MIWKARPVPVQFIFKPFRKFAWHSDTQSTHNIIILFRARLFFLPRWLPQTPFPPFFNTYKSGGQKIIVPLTLSSFWSIAHFLWKAFFSDSTCYKYMLYICSLLYKLFYLLCSTLHGSVATALCDYWVPSTGRRRSFLSSLFFFFDYFFSTPRGTGGGDSSHPGGCALAQPPSNPRASKVAWLYGLSQPPFSVVVARRRRTAQNGRAGGLAAGPRGASVPIGPPSPLLRRSGPATRSPLFGYYIIFSFSAISIFF